jgi:hypothetical protein
MTATLAPAAARLRPVTRSVPLTEQRAVDLVLVAIVGAGAVLRLWALGAWHLNYDESFTAMAGRLPLDRMFHYLAVNDSHPPLDYLLHAPLARMGLSEFWIRLPGALCSVAALALFARWLRGRGLVAVLATALLAVSTFQVDHGRVARGYAELELLGVGIAVLVSTWLTRPARRHSVLLGVLVLVGLLTHVSMFLLAFGLLLVPGRRTDRESWWWRGAVVVAVAGWAMLWGPSFLVQARGGHSSWIPATSIATLRTAVANDVTLDAHFAWTVLALVAIGAAELLRRDRRLGRVWLCLFLVPVALGALAGFVEPVVLDRTFTLMAWAPVLAVAFAADAVIRHWRVAGTALAGTALVALLVTTGTAIGTPTGPQAPLSALDARIRLGDIVAVRPAFKAPEMQWSLGVREGVQVHPVHLAELTDSYAVRVGHHSPTGRVWVLDWHAHRRNHLLALAATDCAPIWHGGAAAIRCLPRSEVALATGPPIADSRAAARGPIHS